MKLSSISLSIPFVLAALSSLTTTSAHMSLRNPVPRGSPLNDNAATKDFNCIMAPLNGGSTCAPKPFPCGGYAPDTKVTQTFRAGEIVTVEFFNQNFPDINNADPNANQARHNGGLCEFSLSYDGGQKYTVIGTYKKTCPDIFFGWKVRIPSNAPSCDSPGQCLFSWSWINAVGNREFYQNCADIKIVGNSTKPLPIIDITRANLPIFGNTLTPEGDPANTGNAKGSGPSQADTDANLNSNIGNGSGGNGGNDGNGGNGGSDGNGGNGGNDGNGGNSGNGGNGGNGGNDGNGGNGGNDGNGGNGGNGGNDGNGGNGGNGSSGACTAEGQISCTNAGKSGEFTICSNGQLVTQTCANGLICKPDGDSIACDFPNKRRRSLRRARRS